MTETEDRIITVEELILVLQKMDFKSKVAIKKTPTGNCGSTPINGIINVREGFDWDTGIVFLDTLFGPTESNREAYKKGVIDAIDAIVLDEKDLPKGFEKVKSVQMKKAKEFLKDL